MPSQSPSSRFGRGPRGRSSRGAARDLRVQRKHLALAPRHFLRRSGAPPPKSPSLSFDCHIIQRRGTRATPAVSNLARCIGKDERIVKRTRMISGLFRRPRTPAAHRRRTITIQRGTVSRSALRSLPHLGGRRPRRDRPSSFTGQSRCVRWGSAAGGSTNARQVTIVSSASPGSAMDLDEHGLGRNRRPVQACPPCMRQAARFVGGSTLVSDARPGLPRHARDCS